MKQRYLALAVTLLILSGCAMTYPQTAQEFRKASENSTFVVIEKYQVNRPFQKIAGILKKKSYKCLRAKTRTTASGYMYHDSYTTYYIPTVKISRARAELHLQVTQKGGNNIKVYKEPPAGYFMLVTDITPVGKRKSKVVLYRSRWGHKPLIRAIKGWIDGTISGCPDLTK